MEYTIVAKESPDGHLIGSLREFPDVLAQGRDASDLRSNMSDALGIHLALRLRSAAKPKRSGLKFEDREFINI
jgi:predicted RNase H-like HicB family nuclease